MSQNFRTFDKYVMKVGNCIVHGGITKRPLNVREKEHQRKWPNAHIEKVGRKTTEEGARKWEKDNGYS